MNTVEAALAGLKSDSSMADIDRTIQLLARRMSEDDPNYEDNIETVRKSLADIVTFGQAQQNQLFAFQQFADSINLQNILNYIESNVYDQTTALQAVTRHDIAWFKSTALSNNGKSLVAALLLRLCEQYAKYSNTIWIALANNDMEAFDMTSYEYNQDTV